MEKTVSACGTGNSGSITATRAGTGLSAHLAEAVTVSSADGTTDVALNAPVIITTGTGHVVSVQVTPPHGCVAHWKLQCYRHSVDIGDHARCDEHVYTCTQSGSGRLCA